MNMMNDANELLSDISATNGWDIVMAYNRDLINELLYDQYVWKVANGDDYTPFSYEDSTFGLNFDNILIGPPLVSFEDSTMVDSAMTVRMNFYGGNIIRTDSDGQVIQWERVFPGGEYALKFHVELNYGDGIVSDISDVSINIEESTLLEVEGLGDLPAEVLDVFRTFIKSKKMSYLICQFINATSDSMYPKSFIIRTQRHPDAEVGSLFYTDGAVLFYIETNYGGKGLLPSDNQPWIIPIGNKTAMLLSEELLFGTLLKSEFMNKISDLEMSINNSGDGTYELKLTKGYISTENVITGYDDSYLVVHRISSCDDNGNIRVAHLDMSDFVLKRATSNNELIGQFSSLLFNETFSVYDGHYNHVVNESLEHSGYYSLIFSVDAHGVAINGKADFLVSLPDGGNWSWKGGGLEQFTLEVNDYFNNSNPFYLNQIKDFYARNVIFPLQKTLNFDEVTVINGLELYGNMAISPDALNITPHDGVVAAGQTLKFSIEQSSGEVVSDVIWSVDSTGEDIGSIDPQGEYSAPETGGIVRNRNVIITAQDSSGRTGKVLLTLLTSRFEAETSFILIREEDAQPTYNLKALIPGSNIGTYWYIRSDLADPGSVDVDGTYTPPTSPYEYGQNFLVVVAELFEYDEDRYIIICLQDKEAGRSFIAEPGFRLNVRKDDSVTFSTSSLNFDADQWDIFPEYVSMGELSTPVSSTEGMVTTWSCTYTANFNIPATNLAVIKMSSSKNPYQCGYSIVEIL